MVKSISKLDFKDTEDIIEKFTLPQLLDYLNSSIIQESMSIEEKIEAFRIWFFERDYIVGRPFRQYYLREKYNLCVLQGKDIEASELRSRLVDTMYILSEDEIISKKLSKITKDLSNLEELYSSCMLIKYIDGKNKKWSAPWHIQCRNVICMFIDGRWSIIPVMPRGPEIAGHKEHSELQDVTIGEDLDYFAPQYQRCIKSMNGDAKSEKEIKEIICSSKRDGMLFKCIEMKAKTPENRYWMNALRYIDDPFVQEFVSVSRKITKGGIIIPASNGTAFLTSTNVQNWVICSILLSYNVSYNQIKEMFNNGCNSLDMLKCTNILPEFIKNIISVSNDSPLRVHHFESIGGPNRMTPFDKFPHTELASSYCEEQCGISYLGFSKKLSNGDTFWAPHFTLEHNLMEPVFFKFNSVSETRDALDNIGKVLSGDINWDKFFEIHPISNSELSRSYLPDPEGFVSYLLTDIFGVEGYLYTKSKTVYFYDLHKIHAKNIPKILNMSPKFAEVFPGYRAVKDFFGNINHIEDMVNELRVAVISEEMKNNIPEKALSALSRVSKPVGFKLILNNARDKWVDISIEIASKYFDSFSEFTNKEYNKERRNDIGNMLRNLLMNLECYEDNWINILKREMDSENILRIGKLSPIIVSLWDFIYTV